MKYKMVKYFKLIHYVYSSLYPKIYNRINNFGIQNKSSFDFAFSNWRVRKQNNEAVSPKIIDELPAPTKQVLITKMPSKPKNPKNHQNREVNEHYQDSIVPAPNFRAETVEIKKEVSSNFDKTDGSAKK